MGIISSQIISQVVQGDGRTSVQERHRDHHGVDHEIQYLAAVGLDVNAVLTARAEKLGAAIDMRDAVEAEAANFEVPLTRMAFVRRFTSTERKAIAAAAKINEDVAEFWNMLGWTQSVRVSAIETQTALTMFEQLLLIGPGRAAIIGAS